MAAFRLQETPQAQADLDAIEDFLAARVPDAARRVIAAVADTYQSILDWPKLGNLLPYKGVRMRLVLGFSQFLVLYRFESPEITVVRHSRQPGLDAYFAGPPAMIRPVRLEKKASLASSRAQF